MKELSSFENAVLTKLLAGDHPILHALRSQADRAEVTSRTYTGAGFYCTFSVSSDVLPLEREPNFEIADVFANIKGLQHGAGLVVFVRSGRLTMLEGFSYDEPWPDIIENFELSYPSEPRQLEIPDL